MLTYNIDYAAAEGVEPKILAVRGHPTEQGASDARLADGAQRLQVRQQADLNAFGAPVLLALYNRQTKGKEAELPPDADAVIWEMLQPKPRKERERKDLQSGDGPTTSTERTEQQADGEAGKDKAMSTTTEGAGKAKGKKKAAKKATKKAAKKKTAAKKPTNGGGQPRGEKTLKVKAMLERKSGCTREEILEATGWPTVSVQAMAKAAGLKLKVEKGERPFRYFGS